MSTKKILIINGHPYAKSFNNALAEAYAKGAEAAGAEVQMLTLRELDFQVNLAGGYSEITELEPDLLKAQEMIKWAEHTVWVHPVWWGSYPALLKGFIDRTFLPGFAFKYRENSVWWDRLLKGRSARMITTLDQPAFVYRWFNRRPSHNSLKRMTLGFSGIKPVRITVFGPVRHAKDSQREKWLKKVEALGRAMK